MAKARLPMMPVRHWFALRDRFKRSIPGTIDANFLASSLGMTKDSATANILPALRQTGLIDEAGKPTQRAVDWRDNSQYAKVCDEILKGVYPQGLRDTAPDPDTRDEAQNWLMHQLGVGESAARKMASFYVMLLTKDVSARPISANATSQTRTGKPKAARAKASSKSDDAPKPRDALTRDQDRGATLHLNLQIHVTPDLAPEQVDSLFESMAKHLKGLISQ